ncbi:MAG TPA: hypothetical protein VK176_11655 [Phycisphaerales bacterium]|nr:hypothetical protein [Phycisphaerales bacterium]
MAKKPSNPRADWVVAMHHFLQALVHAPASEVDLIAELTQGAIARRRQTPDRQEIHVEPMPVRGRLQVLASLDPAGAMTDPSKLDVRRLIQQCGGAVRVIRDVVDRYGLTPEDRHDFYVADLWIATTVNELQRRYVLRRDPDTAEVILPNTRAGQGAAVPLRRKGPQ